MADTRDWISDLVDDARTDQPLVTDGTSQKLLGLLRQEMTEGSLKPKELTSLADDLLASMSESQKDSTE